MTLHQALYCRNERHTCTRLTVRRAVGLKLLLEEPLTKPLGSMCSFRADADVTLVQHRMGRSRPGWVPLTAAAPRVEPHGFPFLVETPTEMGRIRDSAHARLAVLEAAAQGAPAGRVWGREPGWLAALEVTADGGACVCGVRDSTHARPAALEAVAQRGAPVGRVRDSGPGQLAAFEAVAQRGAPVGRVRDGAYARLAALEAAADDGPSDDAEDFRAARIALRRAYASYRLGSVRSAGSGDVELFRAGGAPRQRARAAWLWAAGLGVCTMFLAYALTLLFLQQSRLESASAVEAVQARCLESACD